MKETLRSITESTSISFGLMLAVGAGLLTGYNKLWEVQFKADSTAAANARLEARVNDLEHRQSDMQNMAMDVAVIKSKVETIEKNLPARK